MPGGESIFYPLGFAIKVEGGVGVFNLDMVKHVRVFWFGDVETVWGFMAKHKEEGFVAGFF